jgi:excisionase family DNA binding protein
MAHTASKHPHLTKRLLTLKHAAEYLDFSPGNVRQLIHAGELPYLQRGRGGKVWLDRGDLDQWIERNKRCEKN